MSKVLDIFRRSLSARLSFAVVLFVAAIFVGTFSIMFTEARDLVRDKAWGKATQTLDGTVLHIDNTLRHVEVSSDNMLRVIERNLNKPDSMFSLSKQVLVNNPELTGCSISFDPYYYKEKGKYFSAYAYNDGDSIQTEQEGTDNYQYHCMDWYLIPRLLDRPYWIEPFMEDATEGIIVKDIFSSYSRPIHDAKGNCVGTFSVDIRLEWFTKTISEIKPYPHSFCVMLGKGGTYLVHPDSTKLFYETIFTRTLEEPDSMMTALGTSMLAGESGHKTINYQGEPCHVFYRPFKNTGWSVAVVIPESDILAPYSRLKGYTLWISAAGLCGEDMKRAWRIWRRDRLRHESPNSAQTESACAGALGVCLAGDASYFGKVKKKPVIGDSVREIRREDIGRANRMMSVVSILATALAVLLRLGIWRLIFG